VKDFFEWRVDYTFSPGVLLRDASGVHVDQKLEFLIDGKSLVGLKHFVRQPFDVPEAEVKEYSKVTLSCLLIALRYLQLTPLHWWSDAARIDPPDHVLRMIAHSTGTVGPRPIALPAEGWNSPTNVQLTSWLHFATEAQESPSAAIAIRLYFLILEEIGRSAFDDLKAIRDFVSHPKIVSPKTKGRLQNIAPPLTVGPNAFAHTPSDKNQAHVLDKWRASAREIVDTELSRRLGIS